MTCAGLELATLMVISTNCIISCKSKYDVITTTIDPSQVRIGTQKMMWSNRFLVAQHSSDDICSVVMQMNSHVWKMPRPLRVESNLQQLIIGKLLLLLSNTDRLQKIKDYVRGRNQIQVFVVIHCKANIFDHISFICTCCHLFTNMIHYQLIILLCVFTF